MHIKYKIIEVHPEQHSIVVRFYSDTLSEESLDTHQAGVSDLGRCKFDLNITLYKTPAMTGDALHKHISQCAPIYAMALEDDIRNPNVDTSLVGMYDLVGQVLDLLEPPPIPTNITPVTV